MIRENGNRSAGNGRTRACGHFGLWAVCALLLTACIGGGTDDPNNLVPIIGKVRGPDMALLPDAEIHFQQRTLSAHGSVLVWDTMVYADSLGRFRVPEIPPGNYVLYGRFDTLSILIGDMRMPSPDSTRFQLVLKESIRLTGRALLDSNDTTGLAHLNIFPLGLDTMVHPDSQGIYSLKGIPQGAYNLVFTKGPTIRTLPLKFSEGAQEEVFVRDVEIKDQTDGIPGQPIEIKTKVYVPGQEPAWYQGKDFSGLD